MYLDIQKDPNRDNKWTMFILILAAAFVMFCATCEGQQLTRYKHDGYWYAMTLRTITESNDTVWFGSVYYPTPYQFYRVIVTTSGKDKCVNKLSLIINYTDGTTDYISSWDSNCEGTSYFYLTQYEYSHLKTKEIKNVKLVNHQNHHVFETYDWEKQYYKIVLNN